MFRGGSFRQLGKFLFSTWQALSIFIFTVYFLKVDYSISWCALTIDDLLCCCQSTLLAYCSGQWKLQKTSLLWRRCSWDLSHHRVSFEWWRLPLFLIMPVHFSLFSDTKGQFRSAWGNWLHMDHFPSQVLQWLQVK